MKSVNIIDDFFLSDTKSAMTDSTELVRSESLINEADSVASFMSDDVQDIEEEEEQKELKEYDKAPHDIMFNYEGKEVRVMKEGEKVPCETKYKRVSSTTAIKFRFAFNFEKFVLFKKYSFCRVSEVLEVQILKKLDCTDKIFKTPDFIKAASSSRKLTATDTDGVEATTDEFYSPSGRGLPIKKRRLENEDDIDRPADMTKKRMKEEIGSPGTSFRSQADWIRHLDKNFEEVICGGELLTIFGIVFI